MDTSLEKHLHTVKMYDFNAIQSNAIFGGMEGWGYREIKLWVIYMPVYTLHSFLLIK